LDQADLYPEKIIIKDAFLLFTFFLSCDSQPASLDGMAAGHVMAEKTTFFCN
jgi:hypothetical protein